MSYSHELKLFWRNESILAYQIIDIEWVIVQNYIKTNKRIIMFDKIVSVEWVKLKNINYNTETNHSWPINIKTGEWIIR